MSLRSYRQARSEKDDIPAAAIGHAAPLLGRDYLLASRRCVRPPSWFVSSRYPRAFNCESSTSSILSASLNDAQPVNFISRFFALALREGQRQHDAALMTFSRSASVEGIAFSPRAKFYLGVSNRVPP